MRSAAAAALGYLGEHGVEALAGVLEQSMPSSDPDGERSSRALQTAAALHGLTLSSDELCSSKIDLIVHRMDDPCKSVQQAAGTTLGNLGALSADAIAQKLSIEDPHERELLVTAMGHMGLHALPYTNMLVALLDSKTESVSQVRVAAAKALAKCGPETGKATAVALADFMATSEAAGSQREKEISAGKDALIAFGREIAVPTLPGLLRHKQPDVKLAALEIRQSLGQSADDPEVVRQLAACASDTNDQVRQQTVQTLLLMEDPMMANQVLPKLLEDQNVLVAKSAISIIGKMGLKAAEQALAVSKQLKTVDTDHRRSAAWAMGQLGLVPTGALKAMAAQLKVEKIEEIRSLLIKAIGKQGRTADCSSLSFQRNSKILAL